MTRPNWTKSFSFTLDWQAGMPGRALVQWEESLKFLNEVLKTYKVPLIHVYLHWHKDPDVAHYCGITYIDEKRMAFCQGNDKDTMLHEVAHVLMNYPEHDEKWANRLIDLHHAHLKGSELKKADAELVKDYGTAAKAYKKRFGKLPGPVKKKARSTVEPEGV